MIIQTNNSENLNQAPLGDTMKSNFLKEKMCGAAEKCGNALLQYYALMGDTVHEKSMKYLLNDLLAAKTEEEEYICETIYDQANTHMAMAMKHGYTAEDLADLRSSINQFMVLTKNKRKTVGNKRRLEDIMLRHGS